MRGPLLCSHAVLPSMIERRKGRIVNITSGAAAAHLPYAGAYCASKAALTHWTRCLAGELREYGISAFALTPGAIWTSMTRYLVSDEAPEALRDRANLVLSDENRTPIELSVERFLFVASGKAGVLSGRFLGIRQDISELVWRADEIQRGDFQILHMRNLPVG